jgi:hypothetical protein
MWTIFSMPYLDGTKEKAASQKSSREEINAADFPPEKYRPARKRVPALYGIEF